MYWLAHPLGTMPFEVRSSDQACCIMCENLALKWETVSHLWGVVAQWFERHSVGAVVA